MTQASGPGLVTHGDSLSTAAQRQDRRAGRLRLKEVQRGLTASISGRLCFLPLAAGIVAVRVGRRLIAHVSGVAHCGSPWSCPVCSPVVAAGRAEEINRGVSGHLDAGGGVLFVTFTGAHHRGDRLAPLLGVMCQALRQTLKGRPWVRLRDSLGYVGSIRVVEVTFGLNGWHPHTHALLFFDRPVTDVEALELRSHLFGRWEAFLQRRGFGELHPVHGVDVRPVGSVEELGEYMAKGGELENVGLEMARADLKDRSASPWTFLESFAEGGDVDALDRWLEYERATFGKKRLVWSNGLRDRLLGGPERSDEELATLEGEDVSLVEVRILGEDWRLWCRSGEVGELLRRIEETAALFICMALYSGDLKGLENGQD